MVNGAISLGLTGDVGCLLVLDSGLESGLNGGLILSSPLLSLLECLCLGLGELPSSESYFVFVFGSSIRVKLASGFTAEDEQEFERLNEQSQENLADVVEESTSEEEVDEEEDVEDTDGNQAGDKQQSKQENDNISTEFKGEGGPELAKDQSLDTIQGGNIDESIDEKNNPLDRQYIRNRVQRDIQKTSIKQKIKRNTSKHRGKKSTMPTKELYY